MELSGGQVFAIGIVPEICSFLKGLANEARSRSLGVLALIEARSVATLI
jgi:hypothetical protein